MDFDPDGFSSTPMGAMAKVSSILYMEHMRDSVCLISAMIEASDKAHDQDMFTLIAEVADYHMAMLRAMVEGGSVTPGFANEVLQSSEQLRNFEVVVPGMN